MRNVAGIGTDAYQSKIFRASDTVGQVSRSFTRLRAGSILSNVEIDQHRYVDSGP
jgi:hypothetical protein